MAAGHGTAKATQLARVNAIPRVTSRQTHQPAGVNGRIATRPICSTREVCGEDRRKRTSQARLGFHHLVAVRPQDGLEVVPLPDVVARLDGPLRLARPALPGDGYARGFFINQQLDNFLQPTENNERRERQERKLRHDEARTRMISGGPIGVRAMADPL